MIIGTQYDLNVTRGGALLYLPTDTMSTPNRQGASIPSLRVAEHTPCTAIYLDQNVRGYYFSKKSNSWFESDLSNKIEAYSSIAILPFTFLEHAGIQAKDIVKPIFCRHIKKYEKMFSDNNWGGFIKFKSDLEKDFRQSLTKDGVQKRLEDLGRDSRINLENEFTQECKMLLPEIYDAGVIPQLLWDCILKMTCELTKKYKSRKTRADKKAMVHCIDKMRHQIAQQGLSGHLYMLRFFVMMEELIPSLSEEDHLHLTEKNHEYKKIEKHGLQVFESILKGKGLKKSEKLKLHQDLGDVEYLQAAVLGQFSPNLKQRRPVDVFTMDSANQVKHRLILFMQYYNILKLYNNRHNNLWPYGLDKKYFGCIYILDDPCQTKKQKISLVEKIDVKNLFPRNVLMQIMLNYPHKISLEHL